MLDTVRLVETPEGVALHLHPAGVMPRAAAWVIDFSVRLMLVFTVLTVLAALGSTGVGLSLILLFAIYWLYPVLFELLQDGQTIGKRVVGLRVIHANGTPVSWLASIVRNLLRVVDMLPLMYGFGAVASLLDPQGRRLGDMVAGTLVVHVQRPEAQPPLPPVPVVQSEVSLLPAERVAVVAFAERAQRLTPERREELAALVPMLTGARGGLAVQRLLGLASGILGRR